MRSAGRVAFPWQHLDRTACILVAERLAGSRVLYLLVLSAEAVEPLLWLLLLKVMMVVLVMMMVMEDLPLMIVVVAILEVLLSENSNHFLHFRRHADISLTAEGRRYKEISPLK